MIFTNLAANMVLVSGLHVIQTNTPAFQEYALNAMVTNAQAIALAWNLETNLVSTNNITHFVAHPKIPGVDGNIIFANHYSFSYSFGCFGGFYDLQNDRMAAETPNLKTNNAIYESWMKATNLLTMESAKQLAIHSTRVIGMRKEFNEPKESHQLRYEWKDGKKYQLPYYGFDWSDERNILRMDVSGVNGRIVYYFAMGQSPRLTPPTNYFELLGLPKDPIFVNQVSKTPPTYELEFDPKHPPKR